MPNFYGFDFLCFVILIIGNIKLLSQRIRLAILRFPGLNNLIIVSSLKIYFKYKLVTLYNKWIILAIELDIKSTLRKDEYFKEEANFDFSLIIPLYITS